MRHGVVLFTSDRGITPARAAQAAEAAGFDCFYVPEHTHIPVRREALHPGTGTSELPDDRYMRTLDPWVSLSMAAAVTSTIRLGTAVALPAEHDPITLAKTIASLDPAEEARWKDKIAGRDAVMVRAISAGVHVASVSDYALATLVRSLVPASPTGT